MGFLSIAPHLSQSDGKLIARTSPGLKFLTLGFSNRTVTVDPKRRTITIENRPFGLNLEPRVVGFDQIERVTYTYRDWNIMAGISRTYDSVDCFTVGLDIAGGKRAHLFRFVGEGAFVNDSHLPDWAYWDEHHFDLTGAQEQESKLFYDLLQKMLTEPTRRRGARNSEVSSEAEERPPVHG